MKYYQTPELNVIEIEATVDTITASTQGDASVLDWSDGNVIMQ